MGQNQIVKMGKLEEKRRSVKPSARDVFSELPDAVFHQILSLVPTIQAIRISLVSKRWRQLCLTVPVLSFSDDDFDKHISGESHFAIVSNCLRLREADMVGSGNAPVTKFQLQAGYCDDSSLDSWLSLVANSKVKELDLSGQTEFDSPYPVPKNILCMRSLTHLKLNWVQFETWLPPPLISLPNLVSLVLEEVSMTNENLDVLLLGCPSLQKLFLSSCSDAVDDSLVCPKILSPSLKSLEYRSEYQILKIDGINLESIAIDGPQVCLTSNFPACRSLTLSPFYTRKHGYQWLELEDIISKLPCLESLVLCSRDLRYAKICSQKLRRLTLCMARDAEYEVAIDAPELVYFGFCGVPPVRVSMNFPNLLEADLGLYHYKKYELTWHTNLIYFLSKLGCCTKSVVFRVRYDEKALIIPKKLREICKPPLPLLKHITVVTYYPFTGWRKLKKSLVWMAPSRETLKNYEKKNTSCRACSVIF